MIITAIHESFSSRLIWVPPSVSKGGSALFETSVLMYFGYALKIPDWFISEMVSFSFLMWNGPLTVSKLWTGVMTSEEILF